MNRASKLSLPVAAALVAGGFAVAQEGAAPAADNARYVAELKKQIAGKEKAPAKEVFKNLKLMGDQPAERLLAIMEMGFAKSLGVSCTHCHNPQAWDSDEKDAKQIAREMNAMSRVIRDQLKSIEKLGNRNPVVNCTTCHRGNVKPATNL
jgi:hypothetical protein